ncbi:MAG: hypothetical protein KTQ49_03955 [Candidatus Omnitrophica bacterium]|nr:hypothetical protein [Candidatus Omnitrophota bacterium]
MLKHPVVIDDQDQVKRTAVSGLRGRLPTATEEPVDPSFAAYFNNKMTLLLFLIQAQKVKPNPALVGTVQRFLDEMFFRLGERPRHRYRRMFQWLGRFFRKLPDVTVYQRDRAKDFIRAVYDAFGIYLKNEI